MYYNAERLKRDTWSAWRLVHFVGGHIGTKLNHNIQKDTRFH